LEILAADQASVDIIVEERNGTQLLKVKVQHRAVYSVQVGTASAQPVLCNTAQSKSEQT